MTAEYLFRMKAQSIHKLKKYAFYILFLLHNQVYRFNILPFNTIILLRQKYTLA